jgi:hypothetical protein
MEKVRILTWAVCKALQCCGEAVGYWFICLVACSWHNPVSSEVVYIWSIVGSLILFAITHATTWLTED